MPQLMTKWGEHISKDLPHPEYPRPSLVRESFFNLNGVWQYCICENREISEESYQGDILVPFSPESYLSGVKKLLKPGMYLHYRKIFSLPADRMKDRLLLHFGGVDQECELYVNRHYVGEHKGGYTAFSFDISSYLQAGENQLYLRVQDATEKKPHARGKQKLHRRGRYGSLFYTPQSGIWKTVWMESVPEDYIRNVRLRPCFDEASVGVYIESAGKEQRARVEIWEAQNLILEKEVAVNQENILSLGTFRAWHPDSPFLYDVRIYYGQDRADSYFGMRKYAVGKDSKGKLRFFLNNRPFFFNGVLDQGYWPESLMTPPSDAALAQDIYRLKALGYNTIRKHVKVEWERFYYHCDKAGMAVWQDMPNGGGDYNMLFVTYLPNIFPFFGRMIEDSFYALFRRKDVQGREQYKKDLKAMIARLYNHPCIAVWVPFNEGWGQFDAGKATALIRKMDKTRLVNEACGWFDQKGGDMYSIHNYIRKLKLRERKDRVAALTEFGGYAYPVPGHLACTKRFGYQVYRSKKELTKNYQRLWEEEIYPNISKGLCSAIYTQTSDIEEEINGIFTYDRKVLKLSAKHLRALHQKLYRIFEKSV